MEDSDTNGNLHWNTSGDSRFEAVSEPFLGFITPHWYGLSVLEGTSGALCKTAQGLSVLEGISGALCKAMQGLNCFQGQGIGYQWGFEVSKHIRTTFEFITPTCIQCFHDEL